MPGETATHVPVTGEVIPRSTIKTLLGILLFVVLLLASVCIVGAYFLDIALPVGKVAVKINLAGVLVAGAGILISPLAIVALGFLLLVQERIVVGEDRLQVLQRWAGSDKVVVQIPFRNIARIACATDDGVQFVGIDVASTSDRDTFNTAANLENEKKSHGWHYRILGGYSQTVTAIQKRIAERLDEYHRQRER